MADTDDKITNGILGLGGAPVPKEPTDPSAENDPESVARRRSRMREGDDEHVQTEALDRQHSGATGIDMGAGGQGTDVSRD
jgi:hypothetical protein